MNRRTPDDLPSYDEQGDRIYYVKAPNGYSALLQTVFVAVVLGAGGVIWALMGQNSRLEHRVTVLEWKCENKPVERGG